jgi:RHS repeat-associated protein
MKFLPTGWARRLRWWRRLASAWSRGSAYDSFGKRSQIGRLGQPYGFTDREQDAESGLIHFRARAHDPETGQFLQRAQSVSRRAT